MQRALRNINLACTAEQQDELRAIKQATDLQQQEVNPQSHSEFGKE